MKNYLGIFIATILSPPTAGIGYGLAFYSRWPNEFNKLVESKGLYHMIGPDIYVTGFAYGLTLVFGVPGYLVLRKMKLDKSYLIVGWAILIGVLFTYIFSYGGNEWNWEYGVIPALFVSITAISVLNIFKNVAKKI